MINPRLTIAFTAAACLLPAARLHAGPALRSATRPVISRRSRGQSPQAALGQQLFFDTTLSSPPGQSCGSCHSPETGFRFPNSDINHDFGVATGAINTRFTSRSVPTITYAAFVLHGPPHAVGFAADISPRGEAAFAGGLFWDGHADGLENQARLPFLHPNEMNNLVHNVGDPALVVQKLMNGPNARLFQEVYGEEIFSQPTEIVYTNLVEAIAAYERTPEVSPFSSKYDAWLIGQATLTPEEFDGLCLMTGSSTGRPSGPPFYKNAQCIACHVIGDFPEEGPFIWSDFTYANIGLPKNLDNPFYAQTDSTSNPVGYNPQGENFIDLGLGDFLYPLNGLPPGNMGPGSNNFGDYLAVNGTFRVQTLRNVDKRPNANFVKPYMHNGVFKNLHDVVHFYNTRNLTTEPGEIIDFTQEDPYANLKGVPLWPTPELPSPDSMENPTGATSDDGGQVGNLGLTATEEDHIVQFLKTLSDGYFINQPPTISVQPADTAACIGGAATLSVTVSGTPAFFYQWYRGTTLLVDSGEISGAATPVLSINPVGPQNSAADYNCVIHNNAGTEITRNASLIAFVAGSADGNQDGHVDGDDIQLFLRILHSNPQPGSAFCAFDLNSDAHVDSNDIAPFVAALLNE